MNLLARREHSEMELMLKLKSRHFTEPLIRELLTQLIQENLLSHDRFAENYIHFRSQKGYGPLRIEKELAERGLAKELIARHLNMSDNAWFELARVVWKKKFKNKMPHDFKTQTQQMRFLQYRGFTLEHITSIFNV